MIKCAVAMYSTLMCKGLHLYRHHWNTLLRIRVTLPEYSVCLNMTDNKFERMSKNFCFLGQAISDVGWTRWATWPRLKRGIQSNWHIEN